MKNGFITHYSNLINKQTSKKIINSLPKQSKYVYLLKKNKGKNMKNY